MDNRDRDKVSRSEGPTEDGDVTPVNPNPSEERAARKDTTPEFGEDTERKRFPRSGSSPLEH